MAICSIALAALVAMGSGQCRPPQPPAQADAPLPVGDPVVSDFPPSGPTVRVLLASQTQTVIEGSDPVAAQPDRPIFVQPFAVSDEPAALGEAELPPPIPPPALAFAAPAPQAVALAVDAGDGPVALLAVAATGPVGTPDAYAVASDATLSIAAPGFLANDVDLDGEALTAVSIQDNVDHGTLAAFADGSFVYTPDAGFTGPDGFSYRMRDASNNFSDPVAVTIEVLPPANRTPIGTPDAYAMLADATLSITAPGFLANDVDLDGEPLSAVTIQDNVDHGTLVAFADGHFVYTPDAGFTGSDAFAYRMRDASNNFSDPVLVTIEVHEGNRVPIGVPDTYAVVMNTARSIAAPGFLANDVDLDGEALTAVTIQDDVDHGTLVAFPDGRFTYTPAPGFTGTDAFRYRMRDASNHLSDPVTVTLEVSPAGTTPVGAPDAYQVASDATLSIAAPGFLANDVDLDGEALTAVTIQDNVDHGTLAAFGDGHFTYTPDADFTGPDGFSYRMRDASNNLSDPVAVTIEVLPPANRTPLGTPDVYATLADEALIVTAPGFLANDLDLDGDALTAVTISDGVDHGTLAAFADGHFIYTPDAGFTGSDAFAYRMRDAANNLSDPVTVTIEVYEGNRVPIGVPDAYAVVIGTTLSIAAPGFLANDLDLDGEALTAVTIPDGVDHGTLAAFADGHFVYTPDAGFTGSDAFTYRMRDASNHFSEPVLVTIDVIDPDAGHPCDVDGNGAIDIDDVDAITANRDTTNPLYDVDGDGTVTGLDARQCVLACDNPRCEP